MDRGEASDFISIQEYKLIFSRPHGLVAFSILKQKCKGKLATQKIFRPKQPMIMETEGAPMKEVWRTSNTSVHGVTAEDGMQTPTFQLVLEPEEDPEFCVITVELPMLVCCIQIKRH